MIKHGSLSCLGQFVIIHTSIVVKKFQIFSECLQKLAKINSLVLQIVHQIISLNFSDLVSFGYL